MTQVGALRQQREGDRAGAGADLVDAGALRQLGRPPRPAARSPGAATARAGRRRSRCCGTAPGRGRRRAARARRGGCTFASMSAGGLAARRRRRDAVAFQRAASTHDRSASSRDVVDPRRRRAAPSHRRPARSPARRGVRPAESSTGDIPGLPLVVDRSKTLAYAPLVPISAQGRGLQGIAGLVAAGRPMPPWRCTTIAIQIAPMIIIARLSSCAAVSPSESRVLRRRNSTRKRSVPA